MSGDEVAAEEDEDEAASAAASTRSKSTAKPAPVGKVSAKAASKRK